MDHVEECKQDVVVAAQEEREAHRALVEGRGPIHPEWSAEDTEGYRARLKRWQDASHALVETLDRLEGAQRERRRLQTLHD